MPWRIRRTARGCGCARRSVPTHGWPAGTTEARDPNWAWRAFMVRDEREEFPTTPTAVSRSTPVELPARSAARPRARLARVGGAPHGLRPRVLLPAERRRRHLREGPAGSVGGAPRAGRRAAADAADAEAGFTPDGPAAVHRPQGVADAARRDDLAVRTSAHRRRRRLGRRRQRSGVPAAAARHPAAVGARRRLHRRRRDLRRQPGRWSTTSCARRC